MKAIILRGLPGSGKSTKAKELGGVICSADDFFMKDGVYCYDAKLQGLAHARCIEKFEKSCKESEPLIVVDNCNTREEYYKPYIDIAKKFGYEVEIITLPLIHPEESYIRNNHDVPLIICQKMYDDLTKLLDSVTI
jgi:predicted kinase